RIGEPWPGSELADVVCVGKALGGGLPLSAALFYRERLEELWQLGPADVYTHTHVGNPLACAAALVLLEELPALLDNVREQGERFERAGWHGRGLLRARAGSAGDALARGVLVVPAGLDGSLLQATRLGPAGRVQEERARDALRLRVLLQRLDVEAGAGERRHDRAQAPEIVVEVVVLPASERVDAERHGVVVVDEQLAAIVQRLDDPARPAVEIGQPREHALGGVHEVEAAAPELAGQRLRLRLDPEDLRPPLACRVERLLRGVDRRDDGALLGELGARLAASALEMQHTPLAQAAERRLDDLRQTRPLGAAAAGVRV